MTKTDFAELKEKLTTFDDLDASTLCRFTFQPILRSMMSRNEAYNFGVDNMKYQHTKSAAIISELIEIIQSQSEALEKYQEKAWRFDERDTHRETFAAHTCLSETTTRLQKLRDKMFKTIKTSAIGTHLLNEKTEVYLKSEVDAAVEQLKAENICKDLKITIQHDKITALKSKLKIAADALRSISNVVGTSTLQYQMAQQALSEIGGET